jgi:hypothetical protein
MEPVYETPGGSNAVAIGGAFAPDEVTLRARLSFGNRHCASIGACAVD